MIWTPKFKKNLEKFVKSYPELVPSLKSTIEQLEKNPFHPILRTHKLKGNLYKLYACSINYRFRIVFDFSSENDCSEVILLNIGSHDEVY